MKRPAGRKGRSPDADHTPPGGRALERVQQDRRSRGLPPAEVPGTLTLESDSPTVPRPRAAVQAGRASAKKASKTAAKKTARKAGETSTARSPKKAGTGRAKRSAKKK